MNPQLALELYQRLVAYMSGSARLREFRQWFDAATWDLQAWKSALIGSVELAIAEHLSGDRSETDLKTALSDAISNTTLFVPSSSDVTVVTESESVVQATPTWGATVTILGSPSGRLRVVECA
jgi:hypothetical protein